MIAHGGFSESRWIRGDPERGLAGLSSSWTTAVFLMLGP